jgi:hypothetical protein
MEQSASFDLIILVLSEKFLACWGIPKSILYNCTPSKISFTGVTVPDYSFSCTFRLLVKPLSRRHASLGRKLFALMA